MMSLDEARTTLRRMEEESGSNTGSVVLTMRSGRADLVLSNPKRKNAMSVSMMRQLSDVVAELQQSDAHLLCVRGDGNTFCSGGELNEVRRYLEHAEHGFQMSQAMTVVLDSLQSLPILSCALIDGYAVGGGAEIAMSCDLRVMRRDAWLHFVHRKLGVVPGWGGTRHLIQAVGRAQALSLLLSGERMGAETCHSLSLIDHIADTDWEREVDTFFQVSWGTETLRALKQQFIAANTGVRTGDESVAFSTVWGAKRHQEALSRVFAVRESE